MEGPVPPTDTVKVPLIWREQLPPATSDPGILRPRFNITDCPGLLVSLLCNWGRTHVGTPVGLPPASADSHRSLDPIRAGTTQAQTAEGKRPFHSTNNQLGPAKELRAGRRQVVSHRGCGHHGPRPGAVAGPWLAPGPHAAFIWETGTSKDARCRQDSGSCLLRCVHSTRSYGLMLILRGRVHGPPPDAGQTFLIALPHIVWWE